MELRQLRYFMEVAEREHVSEAAAALHVAQSAISRQIANLEAELGVSLFEREGRNVKLTHIGKVFLAHTKTAMKAIDHAKKQIDEYIDPERGTIKIGFPTSLASNLLPTVVSEFKKKHPKIGFQLRQGSYNFLIESVVNREIDVAFLGPVPTDHSEIKGDILFTENLNALIPSSHPLAEKESLNLRELRNEPFVLFPEGFILHKLVIDGCKQAGYRPNVTSEGEDLDAIKGLVAAGIGMTLLPDSAFSETKSLYTKKVPIHSPEIRRTVGIIIPKHRNLAPSEKVFYNFVKDFFSMLQQFQ
ncbi:LysR family transcriptional regulator [Aquibacillus koreensis]|uniref:LysR family transcriptional regulator n=1 Tax=Aquibacillus koreensis TaxID=279446 RepID=A0A9X3WPP1_9BACI|nr:LysR family transcriptional regulator [Aquibacillus koreensis]MCT2536358.1 LysR family transcriptional regulator [Aquibacillus koreensis]MDC3421291.1 LysR family transcriptional regulator [Aquibacillus koreensis]